MSVIETERLLLEAWDERRREDWVRIAADDEVTRFIGHGEPWRRERAEEVFARQLAHWREHGFGWRSAVERATGVWLGFVGLNRVGPGIEGIGENEVEIGWWLVRAAWGRGLATEGALAVCEEAFGRVGLERIVARYRPDNVASRRVMEKLGMRHELDTVGRAGVPLGVYRLDGVGWRATMAAVTAPLQSLLEHAFPDATELSVVDRTGGGDHFQVTVASPRFDGLPLVDQHRLVYDALAEPLGDGTIHELRIRTRGSR